MGESSIAKEQAENLPKTHVPEANLLAPSLRCRIQATPFTGAESTQGRLVTAFPRVLHGSGVKSAYGELWAANVGRAVSNLRLGPNLFKKTRPMGRTSGP